MAEGRHQSWLDGLRRSTSSGRYIPELDGLRFIAVASVLYNHLQYLITRYSSTPVRLGFFSATVQHWFGGLDLFFMISGFILGLPFALEHIAAGPRVRLKGYYLRRLTRLEPPYVLSMLFYFSIMLALRHQTFTVLFPHLIASLLYVHTIAYHGQYSYINLVAWSLEIEVQFYVLAPFLAYVFLIRRPLARRAVLLAAILGEPELLKHAAIIHRLLPLSLLDELPLFLCGFLLSDIYLTIWNQSPKASPKWDWIAVPAWILFPMCYRWMWIPRVAVPVILLGVLIATFRSPLVRRALGLRIITVIGGMCYSIYLLHFPLMRFLGQHAIIPLVGANVTLNTLLYSVPILTPVLFAATVFFVLIEKPCMQRDWPIRLRNLVRSVKVDRPI